MTAFVIVTLAHTPRPESSKPEARWQPWNWRATAGNGEVLAVSSERYTNRGDAIKAITLLFGPATTVRLVGTVRGEVETLREAVTG